MNDQWIVVCGVNKCGQLGVGYELAPHYSKKLLPLQFNTSCLQKVLPLPLQMLQHDENLKKQFFAARQPELIHASCGALFSIYLSKDPHLLWACGKNDASNLGIPNEKSSSQSSLINEDPSFISMEDFIQKESNVMSVSAVIVNNECNMLRVVCGQEHAFLLLSNMTWMCTGSNHSGQLGFPDHVRKFHQFTPMKNLSVLKEVVTDIFCSSMGCHTFYLTQSHRVYASGKNSCGQLGLGHLQRVYHPMQEVTALSNETIVHIACGPEHSIFLSKEGTIFGCGSPSCGQLGIQSAERSIETPFEIPFSHGKIVDVSCGANHSMVITESGDVYSCGLNRRGQLGLRHMKLSVSVFTKVHFSPAVAIQAVQCGAEHSIFQTIHNDFYSVGNNTMGQLGLGHTVTWSTPMKIRCPIIDGWKKRGLKPKVTCGMNHSVFYAIEPPETKISNHFRHRLHLTTGHLTDVIIVTQR